MSILHFKSSLPYLWFSFFCFSLQIFCHLSNLGLIRSFDASITEKWKDSSLILSLFILALTIVLSSISLVLHLFDGFANSIEDQPMPITSMHRSLPYLSLLDIYVALLILLPKLLLQTQLILSGVNDESLVFESSIDFFLGNVNERVKKDGQSVVLTEKTPVISCELLNLFFLLIRYYLIYSNCFYRWKKCLGLIESVYSFISILFLLSLYGTFEVLFKQLSIVHNQINLSSYLLLLSLFLSMFFIFITQHCLLSFTISIYSQQHHQLSNQLIRLSSLDDRYLLEKPMGRSLVYYLLFVIIAVLSQFPLLIYSIKFLLSSLIDHLLIVYLLLLLLFVFISILFFVFLCFCPFNTIPTPSIVSETFPKSHLNVEENLFQIATPHLIPTRSVSSCGLTVIDHEHYNRVHSHPTFEQTPGVATDALLVMH